MLCGARDTHAICDTVRIIYPQMPEITLGYVVYKITIFLSQNKNKKVLLKLRKI